MTSTGEMASSVVEAAYPTEKRYDPDSPFYYCGFRTLDEINRLNASYGWRKYRKMIIKSAK